MSDGGGIPRDLGGGRYRIEHPLAVNRQDGSVMVYIPAGEFAMGDGRDKDCPKHKVFLSDYWIGVYAVTNAQYLQFMEATKHRAPSNQEHRDAAKAAHPVTNVSWDDALAYAKWAGGELPTEAQWEKAARGPEGQIYPWGNDWDPTRCRHDKNKGNETTCPVFAYPGGISGYGTYNQSGNVWEWCADWYADGYYRQSPARDPRGPAGGSYRSGRGGGWGRGVPVGGPGRVPVRARPGVRPGRVPGLGRPGPPLRRPGVSPREVSFPVLAFMNPPTPNPLPHTPYRSGGRRAVLAPGGSRGARASAPSPANSEPP